MTSRFGTSVCASNASESTQRGESRQSIGGQSGNEPVATIALLKLTSSASSTAIVWASLKRPVPLTHSTPLALKRLATPCVICATTCAFQSFAVAIFTQLVEHRLLDVHGKDLSLFANPPRQPQRKITDSCSDIRNDIAREDLQGIKRLLRFLFFFPLRSNKPRGGAGIHGFCGLPASLRRLVRWVKGEMNGEEQSQQFHGPI